jgi:rare lipoprotein A
MRNGSGRTEGSQRADVSGNAARPVRSLKVRHAGLSGGIASVYSGGGTASGERMNPGALTAAHPSLPFGTKVRVTNSHTGRSVVVRINDRGPFVKGRVIDLSPAAAKAIGVGGIAQVSLSTNWRTPLGGERLWPLCVDRVIPNNEQENAVDSEHVKGAADKVKGAIKDTAGKVTNDKELQAEGKFDKAKGAAHNAAGDVKDAFRNTTKTP